MSTNLLPEGVYFPDNYWIDDYFPDAPGAGAGAGEQGESGIVRTGWELHLRHYDRDGALKNGYIPPLTARYSNSLERDNLLAFSLNSNTYAELESIAEYDLIEVMIRNRYLGVVSGSGGFVRDFVGIIRGSSPDRFTDGTGQTTLSWYAAEQKHVLTWRHIAWPAGVANRSAFDNVPAETAVKELIRYNCTPSASVASGRWRAGDLANMYISFSIETSGGNGVSISLPVMGDLLLDALYKICELGGDYYKLSWAGGSLGGSHVFNVSWGRGGDKTSGTNRVLFSLNNGTITNPARRYRYTSGSVAIAAGQGEGSARAVTIVTDAAYAADNDIEVFVDARNSSTSNGRTSQGQNGLNKTKETDTFQFDVIQTADVFYSPVAVTGRSTYHVGDRILVSYGTTENRRIRQVDVDWVNNGALFNVAVSTELWKA